MEIRMLRYFLTIATEQSFSKAAKVLHITQPTLSRQTRYFEDTLGTELFYRQNKKMYLTESGQLLKKRAEEILLLNDKTEQEFLDRKQEILSGHITIGSVEADNSDTLAMFLEELIAEHPQVHFNIFSSTSDVIMEQLDKGLLDVALLLEPVSTKNYEKITLPRQEKWGILISKESFLANKSQITMEELTGIPLLCSPRYEIQKMMQSLTTEFDQEKLNIVGTFRLIFNIFSLVENKVGAALTIEGAVANRNTEQTIFLPIVPEIKTNCVLVWKKNALLTPTVNAYIEKFKQAF